MVEVVINFDSIAIEAIVFEAEAPLEACEWNVPETRRENAEKLVSAEDAVKIIAHRVEAQFGLVLVMTSPLVLHKLNRCVAKDGQEPVPSAKQEHCEDDGEVEDVQKHHEHSVLSVQVVVLE